MCFVIGAAEQEKAAGPGEAPSGDDQGRRGCGPADDRLPGNEDKQGFLQVNHCNDQEIGEDHLCHAPEQGTIQSILDEAGQMSAHRRGSYRGLILTALIRKTNKGWQFLNLTVDFL
jgi:hypothetical protein